MIEITTAPSIFHPESPASAVQTPAFTQVWGPKRPILPVASPTCRKSGGLTGTPAKQSTSDSKAFGHRRRHGRGWAHRGAPKHGIWECLGPPRLCIALSTEFMMSDRSSDLGHHLSFPFQSPNAFRRLLHLPAYPSPPLSHSSARLRTVGRAAQHEAIEVQDIGPRHHLGPGTRFGKREPGVLTRVEIGLEKDSERKGIVSVFRPLPCGIPIQK